MPIMNDEFSRLNRERILLSELAENAVAKMPVCLCIDTSYSMGEHQKILDVNNGIRRMLSDMRKSIYSRDSVELCMISFGGEDIEVVCDFTDVSKINFKDFSFKGSTPLGKAVKYAAEYITKRVDLYRKAGVQYYRPWLIIISDGKADDEEECRQSASKIREMCRNRQLNVICGSFGNDYRSLTDFANKNNIIDIEKISVVDFFSYLSKSVEKMNQSSCLFNEEEVMSELQDYIINGW